MSEGKDRRVRIEDVARVAGVSPITVSRALSNPESVRHETLNRVNAAVAQIGYTLPTFERSTRVAIRSRLPNSLCHFTTVDGLFGIVSTSALWASDVSFLNDRAEILHGLDITERVLEEIGLSGNVPRALLRTVVNDLKENTPRVFATCFCTKDDLLSQWRGYAPRQQGVSIKFSRVELGDHFSSISADLGEVIYDQETSKKFISESIRNFVRDGQEPQTFESLKSLVLKLVPQFKNDGFSEENEFRYIVDHNLSPEDLLFRVRDGVIIPYLATKSPPEKKLPIEEIVVGPGNKQDIALRSIRLFLNQKGYQHVPIRASAVPYRE